MEDIMRMIARLGGPRRPAEQLVLCRTAEAARRLRTGELDAAAADAAARLGHPWDAPSVLRALSREAAELWERGCRRELERLCGRRLRAPPAPGELVLCLAEQTALWEELRAGVREAVYWRWEALSGASFGVAALLRGPERRAVTGPLSRSGERVGRLVRRLNAERISPAEFEERYLTGTLLDLLE